ncbi:MAG: hypothetical protein J5I93_08660 [Pirellulaceae bacterium]|nr:hypothetical protein [Pirellulaceae bacterium]
MVYGASRRTLLLVLAVFLFLPWAVPAQADLRPPGREPRIVPRPAELQSAPLVVRQAADNQPTRIVIPRRYLANQIGATEVPASGSQVTRTVMSGVFLSAALACGVLLVVRRRHKAVTAGLLLILVGSGLGAGRLWADIPVPRPPAGPRVTIELVNQGDSVTVYLGKDFPAR